MTKWVFQNKLSKKERERIANASAFLPTKELSPTTGLPEIAITQPVFDMSSDRYIGRDYVDVYPRGFLMPGESWAGPNLALKYAKQFLTEALGYVEIEYANTRFDCIKSAELLLLHSAFFRKWQGSAESWRLLGEIYYNDWAKKNYWLTDGEYEVLPTYPKLLKIQNPSDRAIYCFNKSRDGGDVEANVFYGECLLYGVGTKLNENEAFELFLNTFNKTLNVNARCVGMCAKNLANCYEYALGTTLNFKLAKDYYTKAIQAYKIALDHGEDLLEPNLVICEKGLERCKQELEEIPFGYKHSYRPRRYCD